MITLNNLSLDFAGNIIFNNISIQIKKNDKIGLIGNNGSGKTTLLNLLSKQINPTDGTVLQEKRLKVAYLPQELNFNTNINLKEFVIGNKSKIIELDKKIDEINNLLSKEKLEKKQFELLDQLENIQHKRDSINTLELEINSEKIMKGLGFNNADLKKNVNDFSGGWKMRAELSRLLVLNPDIILLDEPTNHLDLPAIIWLEKFLNTTKLTIILVSHDTNFLNKNVNRIFDISQNMITDFKGNYSKYIIYREKEIERQMKQKKNQDKYIKQANMLIDKFRYKKNKAAFAQTLIRRLKKMDKIKINNFDMSSISFQFPVPLHCGKIIFRSNKLKKVYGDNIIFENLDLDIYNGDRVSFVGKNGCGKTTLTKIINGEIDFEGDIKKGEKVIINYFAQNQNELLDSNLTIIEYIKSIPSEKNDSQLRGLLGAFLFSGDAVYKKIKVLSGGEKARLALCGLLLSPSNVIILDEPTNHLDVFAKDILKQALLQYSGTLILVSHDRHFLRGLTDRVIEFSDKKIREYPGDIDSYLDQQEIIVDIPLIKNKNKNKNKNKKNIIVYKQKKELDKKIRFLNKKNQIIETKIEKIETKIKKFNELLNKSNQENINDQIDYDSYNELNDLLNIELENWEKNQNEINEVTSSNPATSKQD